MNKHLLMPLLLAAALPLQAEELLQVTAAEWARPRDGNTIATHPALREAVHGLAAHPGHRLELRHANGEEGRLWAGELRAWLVALGIPSARIELVPGGGGDRIALVVTDQPTALPEPVTVVSEAAPAPSVDPPPTPEDGEPGYFHLGDY